MENHRTGVSTSIGSLTERFASLDQWHNVRIEFMTLGQLRGAAAQCYQIGKIIREKAAQEGIAPGLVHLYPDMPALGFQFNRKAAQLERDRKEIADAHDTSTAADRAVLTEARRFEKWRERSCENALDRITGHS